MDGTNRSRVRAIALGASIVVFSSCVAADSTIRQERMALSGVIEGFYGTPWSHEDRLDMLRFMGGVGLDAYVYAPKDDPYHLARWREPYPPDRLVELEELATVARASGVQFHYAISPGNSMVYSDPADYTILLEKFEVIAALGVDHMAFFVDDVQPTLAHEADRAVFDDLAHAHATVINRLHDDLTRRGLSLTVTPTTYSDAWGDRTYAERLGRLTNPEVPFFWTGTDVVSPTISRDDGERWSTLLSRPPLIWDNYPVNDYARWRLYLGPFRGRSADAAQSIAGLLSNPMNEAHASMIALATLASYVHDPYDYDPDTALRDALVMLYDDSTAVALQPFLTTYGDYSMDRNAFESLFIPGRPVNITETEARLDDLRGALGALSRLAPSRPTLEPLINDLAPFVDRTQARLRELLADRHYVQVDGILRFRSERDVYAPEETEESIQIDGDFTDWGIPNFYPTFRNGRELRRNPRITFRTQGDYLILGVTVPGRPTSPRSSPDIGVGDHIAIIIHSDTGTDRQGLSAGDLLLLLPAPEPNGQTATVQALSMRFHGFMSKYLADNHNMQFTAFHVSTFGQPPIGPMASVAEGFQYAARSNGFRWTAEIAIPMNETIRLGLFVTRLEEGNARTYSWSRRSYPANPATYVTVRRAN